MNDRNIIGFIAVILVASIIGVIVYGFPSVSTATFMVAIGTFLTAVVAIFSIRETRFLAGLSIQPILRISLISLIPGIPTTPTEVNQADTIYLENIGTGTAKHVKLTLVEMRPVVEKGTFPDNYFFEKEGRLVPSGNQPIISIIDFIPPVRAVESTVSTTREPFKARLLFSPFENGFSEFLVKNEGKAKFFKLKIECKNLRDEKARPVEYFLLGKPTMNQASQKKEWLSWRVYVDFTSPI